MTSDECSREHREDPEKPLASLVCWEDPSANSTDLGVDQHDRIIEFLGKRYFPGQISKRLTYIGVQALSTRVFKYMPAAKGSIFSITKDTHVRMLEDGALLRAQVYPGYWVDAGTPQGMQTASKYLKEISKL